MSKMKKKLALVFVTTLLSVAAAELFFRVFAPVGAGVYAIDDRYLHRYVPNSEKIYRHTKANGGGRIEVKINSLGFREREFARERAPGTRRVVVYGDSFIAAEFTPLEQSFTRQLENHLRERAGGGAVEVVNAGVTAYGPDQISLRLETELDELRPDLVVVALFAGNDFGDLLRNKIYKLGPSGELLRNEYTISPALRRRYRPPRSALLQRLRQALLRGQEEGDVEETEIRRESYTARSVRRCREQYVDYVVRGDNVVRDLRGDQYDADISLGTHPEAARYKRLLMEGVLRQIKQTLEARGVPLVLLFIPASLDLTDEYGVNRGDYPDYDPVALTRALEESAERAHIRRVNLFDVFAASDPATLYFKYPDSHWNEEGQRLASRVAGDYIVSEKLLP